MKPSPFARFAALVISLPALAQNDADFTPLSIPPAAPPGPPVLLSPPAVTSPEGNVLPMVPPPAPPPEKQLPPVWTPFTGSASVLGAAGTNFHVGTEILLGGAFGRAPEIETDDAQMAGGWLWGAGLLFNYGKTQVPGCPVTLCADRYAGGAALRYGRASGIFNKQGVTKIDRWYFGELDVLGAYSQMKSAPLVPGLEWGDLILRLKAGINISTSTSSGKTPQRSIFSVVTASLFFEAIPVSTATRNISAGATLGLAL